jgi:hypothetical protein
MPDGLGSNGDKVPARNRCRDTLQVVAESEYLDFRSLVLLTKPLEFQKACITEGAAIITWSTLLEAYRRFSQMPGKRPRSIPAIVSRQRTPPPIHDRLSPIFIGPPWKDCSYPASSKPAPTIHRAARDGLRLTCPLASPHAWNLPVRCMYVHTFVRCKH